MLTLDEHTTLLELRKRLMSRVADYEGTLQGVEEMLQDYNLEDDEYDEFYDQANELEDAIENTSTVIDHLTEIIFIAESC